MRKLSRILCLAIVACLVISVLPSSSAVDLTLPSLYKTYKDAFMIGTFGGWSSAQQLLHYQVNSPANALKLDSQIGNGSSAARNPSKATYDAAVAAINANTEMSEAEKAAAIDKANKTVTLEDYTYLSNSARSIGMLNAMRVANETRADDDKIYVRGHVFVWHGGQQPNYFFCNGFNYNAANPDWTTPEVMLARLDDFIMKMTERYAPYDDLIISWDVVNEGLDDFTGHVRNADGYQTGQWGRIFRRRDLDNNPDQRLYEESVYIRKAFEYAAKYRAQFNVDWKLYYNDFMDSNKPYEPKASQTFKMLKPIYEAGNIDGFGLQGRLATAAPTLPQFEEYIKNCLTVSNEISFSEADFRSDLVPNPNYDPSVPSWPILAVNDHQRAMGITSLGNNFDTGNAPAIRRYDWPFVNSAASNTIAMREDIQREQADYVAGIFDILLKYKDKVVAIDFDGTSDSGTFNSYKGAHLWGGTTGNPEKMSFFSMLGSKYRFDLKTKIAALPAADEGHRYTSESWAPYAAALTAATSAANIKVYSMTELNTITAASETLTQTAAALASVDGLTLVSTSLTNVVATLPANIPVAVFGKDLGSSAIKITSAEGNVLATGTINGEGDAILRITKVPETASLTITATSGGVEKTATITVVPYNTNIWNMTLGANGTRLALNFNVDIATTSPKFKITINGNDAAVYATTARRITTTTLIANTANGDTVVVEGLKIPALFPSYTFTFKTVYGA